MSHIRIGVLAISMMSVGLVTGCWEDPSLGDNLPPQINGFIIDGERNEAIVLREGEQITVTIVAWDPNGDDLGSDRISWECDRGTVEGTGPSVRIVAPNDIVWETPPQQVVVTCTATVTDGENSPATRDFTVEILPPCPSDNQPPVINGVYAEKDHINLGERTTVWVEASDPEGLDLSFEWTPPFGDIDGTGDRVDWVTDEVCCTEWYDVEVVVSDGCKTSWAFVSVHVDV